MLIFASSTQLTTAAIREALNRWSTPDSDQTVISYEEKERQLDSSICITDVNMHCSQQQQQVQAQMVLSHSYTGMQMPMFSSFMLL